MPGSVFATMEAASDFFRCAPVGYAATPTTGVFDGVALATDDWAITPLHLGEVRSSVLDPLGVPDSAFLMAGVGTTWRTQPLLVTATGTPWSPPAGQGVLLLLAGDLGRIPVLWWARASMTRRWAGAAR